jgi:hypothetical protein
LLGWSQNKDALDIYLDSGSKADDLADEHKIYEVDSNFPAMNDVTLYAIWKVEHTVNTVRFKPNTSSYTGNVYDLSCKQINPAGCMIKLTKDEFSRSKYKFDSWNTEANGKGTAYNPSSIMLITSDVTLYAIWKYVG